MAPLIFQPYISGSQWLLEPVSSSSNISAYQWLCSAYQWLPPLSQSINGCPLCFSLSVAPLIFQPYISGSQWLLLFLSPSVALHLSQPISGCPLCLSLSVAPLISQLISGSSVAPLTCVYLSLSVALLSLSLSLSVPSIALSGAVPSPGLPLLSQPISGSIFIPAYQWFFFIQWLIPYLGLSGPISLSVAPLLSQPINISSLSWPLSGSFIPGNQWLFPYFALTLLQPLSGFSLYLSLSDHVAAILLAHSHTVIRHVIPPGQQLYSAPIWGSLFSMVSGDFLISANFPAIPAKLVQKIRRWEFVELNQLLPDNLISFPNQPESEMTDQKLSRERKKLHPIEDIRSWYLAMLLYTATCHATKRGKC